MERGMSQLIVREHLETKWKVPGDFSDSLSFPRKGGHNELHFPLVS